MEAAKRKALWVMALHQSGTTSVTTTNHCVLSVNDVTAIDYYDQSERLHVRDVRNMHPAKYQLLWSRDGDAVFIGHSE